MQGIQAASMIPMRHISSPHLKNRFVSKMDSHLLKNIFYLGFEASPFYTCIVYATFSRWHVPLIINSWFNYQKQPQTVDHPLMHLKISILLLPDIISFFLGNFFSHIYNKIRSCSQAFFQPLSSNMKETHCMWTVWSPSLSSVLSQFSHITYFWDTFLFSVIVCVMFSTKINLTNTMAMHCAWLI